MNRQATEPEYTVVDSEKMSQQWDPSKADKSEFLDQVAAELRLLLQEVNSCTTTLRDIRRCLVVLLVSVEEA